MLRSHDGQVSDPVNMACLVLSINCVRHVGLLAWPPAVGLGSAPSHAPAPWDAERRSSAQAAGGVVDPAVVGHELAEQRCVHYVRER